MKKSKFCVLTKHYILRRKTLLESKAKFYNYYSDSTPSYGMVQKWFTEFCCGRTSTETIPCPGCPNDITIPEMVNKIDDIVLDDTKLFIIHTNLFYRLQSRPLTK